MAVGGEHSRARGKGGDEHEESGSWEVKVGDEGISALELIAGVDEDRRVAGIFLELTVVFAGDGFESADGGGADGDDAAALDANGVESLGRGGGKSVVLGVHLVLGGVFDGDGTESAETNVEGEFDELNALSLDLLQELGGKVETGSGGGGGAKSFGVDGLVAGLVGERFVDVGREGHGAELV